MPGTAPRRGFSDAERCGDPQLTPVAEDRGALDDRGELAHVAGPVGSARAARCRASRQRQRGAGRGAAPARGREVRRERGDVLARARAAAAARIGNTLMRYQRSSRNVALARPSPARSRCVAATMRTSTVSVFVPADALERAVLQHAQQPHLRRERQLADLVEEQRAAVGALEPTLARARRRR